MNISCFNSIRELNEKEWNEILGSRDYIHSYGFAAALEESKLGCKFRYVVMRNSSGELVAHATLCLVATPLDLFLSKNTTTARLMSMIRKRWPGFLVSKVVECGNPIALGAPIVSRKGASEEERKKMVLGIQQAMRDMARDGKADLLVVRDFSQSDVGSESWREFSDSGFVSAPNLENTVMRIRWSSFEEYLGSMRSHYRYRARCVKKKVNQAGIRRELVTDFSKYASRLAELWMATSTQADSQLRENLNEEFFSNVSRRLGKKSFVSLFWRGDTLVAFTLYFDNGDTLVPLYIGIDYDHNSSEIPLVFNAYLDWVETAMELGYRHMDLGITTYTPKLYIGAQLEPQTVLVRHLHSWLTLPTVMIYRWLTPQQEVTSHNVFCQPQLRQSMERQPRLGEVQILAS